MVPPNVIDIMTQGYKSIVTGAQRAEGPKPPLFQEMTYPPSAYMMASLEGVTPLKMTSFLWIHIAHNVANARLQSCSRLKEPSIRELQNASSDDTTRRATPATRHASCTIGHVKNKCGQSSSSPAHSGQHTSAPGTLRRRMTLVIRRRRKSSQLKIRIFSGSRCFHTTRQRRTIVICLFDSLEL